MPKLLLFAPEKKERPEPACCCYTSTEEIPVPNGGNLFKVKCKMARRCSQRGTNGIWAQTLNKYLTVMQQRRDGAKLTPHNWCGICKRKCEVGCSIGCANNKFEDALKKDFYVTTRATGDHKKRTRWY